MTVLVSRIVDYYHKDTTERIVTHKLKQVERSLIEHATTTLDMYLLLYPESRKNNWLQKHIKTMRQISPLDINYDGEIIFITILTMFPKMSSIDINTLTSEKKALRLLIEKIKSLKNSVSPASKKILKQLAESIGFIFDLFSLLNEIREYKINENSLGDFKKGTWCYEAGKIHKILKDMKKEHKIIRKYCMQNSS